MKPTKENPKEKGWMPKMDGISIYPTTGLKISGKYGKYCVGDSIGKGGNGVVFNVDVIEGGDFLPQKYNYVVKFLVVTLKDENELEKRRLRFKKEIEEVLSFQNTIEGVIPIFDTSIYCEDVSDLLWYLMPKAEAYKPKKFTVLQRMEHMLQLGNCISQLHKMGYAHRDIKPKNLLMLEGKLCIADFGLVWNIDASDEHITEVNDLLGPQAIRPPELQPVENIDGIDYRKSDVYLYAKTIWMILYCNNSGFPSTYSRTQKAIYIDKDKFQFETAEPLHSLMEMATKDEHWERIDIDDCLEYVENQLKVIKGTIPPDILRKWRYIEEVKHLDATVQSDEKVFTSVSAILTILKSMSGAAGVSFKEMGKEYGTFPLKKANHIENNLYEIEIQNPYYNGKKKIIELAIDSIYMKKNMTYEIHSNIYSFDKKAVPIFKQIIKGLECTDKRIRLNSIYLIEIVAAI